VLQHDDDGAAAAARAAAAAALQNYQYRANDMITLIDFHQKHVLFDDDRNEDRDVAYNDYCSSSGSAPTTLLHAHDIDASWLQRTVRQAYGGADDDDAAATTICPDDDDREELAEQILKVLADEGAHDVRGAENRLAALLDYGRFDLLRLLLRNRRKIVWCTRLARAQDEEQRYKMEREMATDPRLAPILYQLLVADDRAYLNSEP
jgi:hypothetical protein